MMKKIAILTDFRGYDQAYGLCQFVRNEIKLLMRNDYMPKLILRDGYRQDECQAAYNLTEFHSIDPGTTGTNRVEVDDNSEEDINRLYMQLCDVLGDTQIVITHDLIYQANSWKQHVAARRLAKRRPDLKWLHVVHSSSVLNTAEKTDKYSQELKGKFPNSLLWTFTNESIDRVGGLYGYEVDEIVVIPPPLDFLEYMHPVSQQIIQEHDLMHADIIIVYPCRLDRGKQPEVAIEITAKLREMHYDARMVLVNSYSNAGAKALFRDELKQQAHSLNVPLVLTSDVTECRVRTPHQVIMNLFELGDVLIQPSLSESYSRILCEAAWHGCALVLNYDLPLFREYTGVASFGKFSSCIDINTGQPGETNTVYSNREAYMHGMAAKIAYHIENDSTLKLHRMMRQERSLEAIWPKLQAIIEGDW